MTPDAEMMAVAVKLARFIETGGAELPSDLFVSGAVTIVENFAPYIFVGSDAVVSWAGKMRAHLEGLTNLHYAFGDVFDFSRTADDVYFSLRCDWSGVNRGQPFRETGGWALVLTRQAEQWRLKGYGWAVIESTSGSLPLQ